MKRSFQVFCAVSMFSSLNAQSILEHRGWASRSGDPKPIAVPSPRRGRYAPLSAALQNRGVTERPYRLWNRAQMLTSDRAHSLIPIPNRDLGGKLLPQHGIGNHRFNDPILRGHMALISKPGHGFSSAEIRSELAHEKAQGRYYWHPHGSFDYCHYNDPWGYHWYGFYSGQSYFWTRYHEDRWWIYDDAFDRWDYWSHGAWWWQDPADLTVVYLYDSGTYVRAELD